MISISIIYFLKHASLELLFRNCTESHHPLYSCTALAQNIFDNRLAFEVINVVYYRQKYRLFVADVYKTKIYRWNKEFKEFLWSNKPLMWVRS